MEQAHDSIQAERDMQAAKAAKKAEQAAKKAEQAAKKAASKTNGSKPAKKAASNGSKPVKKAAKPKAEPGERLIPANLEVYVKDKDHKTAGGHVSVHCGDEVAVKLLGKNLDDVYKLAARALKVEEKELRAKYAKLNVGMQRMNLGNRIRGAAAQAAAA